MVPVQTLLWKSSGRTACIDCILPHCSYNLCCVQAYLLFRARLAPPYTFSAGEESLEVCHLLYCHLLLHCLLLLYCHLLLYCRTWLMHAHPTRVASIYACLSAVCCTHLPPVFCSDKYHANISSTFSLCPCLHTTCSSCLLPCSLQPMRCHMRPPSHTAVATGRTL